MSNPLVAGKQDSTTWHTGINLIDDVAGIQQGVESHSWVETGLSAAGAGLDLLTVAMNPVGTLISYGLNWLIEHVQPLKDALDHLAGDADQIAAYAKTWSNVSEAVNQASKDLADAVQKETANWTGAAADAYRNNIADKGNTLASAASSAQTISSAVSAVGTITGVVRGLVRDMVTQAIGDFVQDAMEEVFSLGLATPFVIAQVVEQVAQWTEKIGAVIKKLISSVEKLRPILTKLEDVWAAIQKSLRSLHGGAEAPHGGGGSHGGTHASSAEPHPAGGGEHGGTPPPDPPGGGSGPDAGGTGPSGAHGPDGPTGSRGPGEDPPAGGQKSEGNGGCDGKGGDPVDAISGQMITSQADLRLPGLLPLNLLRAYASGFRGGRLHGPGWSSTLDQRLEIDADNIRYVGDDAQFMDYVHPGNDAVLPAYGPRWPLRLDADTDTYLIEDVETGWTRHFAPAGDTGVRSVTALTDRDGHRVDYDRDERGLPVAVRHSGGYHVAVDTTDTPGGPRLRALRLLDGDQHGSSNGHGNGGNNGSSNGTAGIPVISYRYDERGRLTDIVNSSGLPLRYEYDENDRITAWTDRNGFGYRYTYRDDGRVIRGESDGGYLDATFDYDLDNRVVTVTDSVGGRTRYHYDEHNHLTTVIDPRGGTELLEFDRYHRLLAYTDQLGRTTRRELNDDGDPIRTVHPDGTVTDVEYDRRWRMPTRIARPGGVIWQHAYSDTGHALRTTDPMGGIEVSELDERGHLALVVGPDGQRWSYTSDGAGRPLSITAPNGGTNTYELDPFGRLRSSVGATGAVTRYGWTIEGKLAWQAGPRGEREELRYDPEGNVLSRRDPVGATVSYEIGPFNLPVSRTGSDGARYTFEYTTELRLARVTNPLGQNWDYTYDANGNLTAESDFTGRLVGYRYDAANQLVGRSEPGGSSIELDRDLAGRVISQRVPGEDEVRFSYDDTGRISRAGDGRTELSYERDLLGRPLAETLDGRTVRSEYDLAGNRIRRITPSGIESTWQLAATGLESGLRGTGGTLSFAHDLAGRETARRIGTAAVLTQSFDGSGQLTEQELLARPVTTAGADTSRGFDTVQRRTFSYRADGFVTGITDGLRGDRTYQLAPSGRVTGVTAASWSEQYAYDALGNVSTAQPGTPSDAAGERVLDGPLLRAAGRRSYEYDAAGRLIRETRRTLSGQRRRWTYGWNGRNQLVTAATPDGARWTYRYDPLGRRVAKARVDEQGVVLEEITFSWDGATLAEQRHQTHTGQDALVTATAWDYLGSDRPVAQTARSWLADAPQEIVDTRFHTIVADLVGTPSELVDDTGRVAWYATTGLWGNQLEVSTQDGVACPLRFPGQYHDAETGLHYNVHRYYDPDTARYLTPDPLGLAPAANHYAYVGNPLVFCDPSGLVQQRGPNGQFTPDPNRPANVHNRSSEYPHEYWPATHEHMVKNFTIEGQDLGEWPTDKFGNKLPRSDLSWVDAAGNPIPYDDLTYDHKPSVVEHWIDEGHNQDKAAREAWYNKTDDMTAMSRSDNSSHGAKIGKNYSDKAPGPNYSCT